MQARTGGRPPDFFDEELRILQFVGTRGKEKDKTIAALINWNAHPESMKGKSTLITSDFPHAVRKSVEEKIGGTVLYVSGDLGATEIVGDTNNNRKDRIAFDGRDFPLEPRGEAPTFTFDRTEAIGRDIAKAALEALERAERIPVGSIDLRKKELRVAVDNKALTLRANEGLLDVPMLPREGEPPIIRTSVYTLTLGEVQIVTAPGELFPELFYGVEKYRRTDCPNADTGRSPESSVRDLMTGKYKFLFGICPDELGYIIPGYDFYAPEFDHSTGDVRLTEDPCKSNGVPDHYHESVTASSMLAAEWTSAVIELLKEK
jgi:hypothetical protein